MADKYKLLELINEYGEAWTLGVHRNLSRAMLDQCARLWARRCAWQVTRVHGRGMNNVQTGSLLIEWLLGGVFGASVGAFDSKHFIPTVNLLRLTNTVLKEEGMGIQVVPMSDDCLYIAGRHGEVEQIVGDALFAKPDSAGFEPEIAAIVADYDLPVTIEEIVEDSWNSALARAHRENIRQRGIKHEQALASTLHPQYIEAARDLYTSVLGDPLPFLDGLQQGVYVPVRVDEYAFRERGENVPRGAKDLTKAIHNVFTGILSPSRLFGRVRLPSIPGVGVLFFINRGHRVALYVDLAKLKRDGLTSEEEELLFSQ